MNFEWTAKSSPNWPPTPYEHLKLFLATVDDYEALDAAHPFGSQIRMFGHGEDDAQRWRVVMHATMLRKYFQPGDVVNLSNVMRALRACTILIDETPDDDWKTAIKDACVIPDKGRVHIGQQPPVGEGQILEDQLYGRVLHGDYGKWMAAGRRTPLVADANVWTAVLDRRRRTRDTAQLVRVRVESGFVDTSWPRT